MILPVKASGWFNTQLSDEEKKALLSEGIVPVNDKILPFWGRTSPIWLFEGGRGGGKSEGVFDRLVRNCIEDKYFNCYYGRKIWDTVHDTCFETIVASIRKQGKEHLFKFSEADNSTMVIRCKLNKNKFEPFGASNPESLKSIKDPSHIVCEEFDQFDLKDFQDLFPTLRTEKAITEFIAMYNSWGVLPDHWINLLFFPDLYVGDKKIQFDALEGIDIQKIFINYTDNYFIDKPAYERKLKVASAGNNLIYEALANGARGVIENGNPWLHAFKDDRHLKRVPFLPTYPIYLNFDFNVDPISCVAVQMSPAKGLPSSFIHFIREFGGKVKVDDLCHQIKTAFPNSIFYFAGDRSGLNEDVGRNQTLYGIISSFFRANDAQMNIQNYNLEHADSRMLCNAMFEHYPHIYIDSIMCPNLVTDCRKATCDPKSVKPSQLLKDRGNFKMDYFDGMRYFFQTYFNKWAKDVYFRVTAKK